MAFHSLNLTMTGGNDRVTAVHTPVRQVVFYNVTGNAAVLVGDRNISATVYGFSIAAASAGPVIGPFSGSLPVNLEELYVRGASNEVLRISYVT